MINVVNKKTHRPTKDDIYIGRPSPLGNPFTTGTREETIEQYEEWLSRKLDERDAAICKAMNHIWKKAKKGDVNLVCWCAPLPCHGEVIREIVNFYL